MTDRQERLRELCLYLTSENDPQQLLKLTTEVNNILGSILSHVDQVMRSVDARLQHLMREAAVTRPN